MAPDEVLPAEENRQTSTFHTQDDLVGHILYERFLIEGDLSNQASGGRCAIYLAKDLKHFCRRVWIKALPTTERSERPSVFQDICDALMRLGHPNIESILETGKLFDGRPYAITAYTPGESLNQILAGDRRLVLDRVAHIVESLAEALAAAHSRKILHCDVTPANILITPQDNNAETVQLTGFGCAWPADLAASRFDDRHSGCESFFYTAPELLVEDGRATPASDIYSLAALAYRMLTGDVPFKSADREEMLELIVRGVPARPSGLRTDLPADAEAILLSALQYKAAMRPRDARTFGLELANELRKGTHHLEAARQINTEVPAFDFPETITEIEVEGAVEAVLAEPRKRASQKAGAIVSDRAIAWSLIVLLLAGALSIPIGQTIQNEADKPFTVGSIVKKPADTRLPREIRYSIEGANIKNQALMASQPMPRNSFVNSGEYRMTFEADAAGNAYVFSEGTGEKGQKVYNVLYPMAKVNSGSAAIVPKLPIKTQAGSFPETRDTEVLWLVWTAGQHDDLESARRSALESDGVVSRENEVQKLKHFLERNKNFKLDISQDAVERRTVLNGSGDRIVHRIEIERN